MYKVDLRRYLTYPTQVQVINKYSLLCEILSEYTYLIKRFGSLLNILYLFEI